MPYRNNNELPASVKNVIPSQKALTMFRRVVNAQLSRKTSEEIAFASAWAALKNAGYKKNDSGNWVKKARGAMPMYGYRPVMNAESIIEWAKSQGFTKSLAADDMHVTVVYSRDGYMVRDYDGAYPYSPYTNLVIRGGKRSVAPLGDGGAVVLKIESLDLMQEWIEHRRMGASWDYEGYVPHVTITYEGAPPDLEGVEPYEGDIVLGPLQMELLSPDYESEVEDITKAEKFMPPAGAKAAAKRALEWKKKYGDAVKGGTAVGWTRANQLASGEGVSRDVVGRMASFNRHRKNSAVDPAYKEEPWKDAGHVAWLLWGGDAGVDWAMQTMDRVNKRMINDDAFTEPNEAISRSFDLGFNGDIHVYEVSGQAVYMPGSSHGEYLRGAQDRAILSPTNQEVDAEDTGEDGEDENEGMDAVKIEIEVKISKRSDEQRIVWGWASVSTVDGQPVFDYHGDYWPPEEMLKTANDFMKNVRKVKVMHGGEDVGLVVHSFPMTKEIAKAFDIETNKEGWIVGTYVENDEQWEKAKRGEFRGFSIGGWGKRHAA